MVTTTTTAVDPQLITTTTIEPTVNSNSSASSTTTTTTTTTTTIDESNNNEIDCKNEMQTTTKVTNDRFERFDAAVKGPIYAQPFEHYPRFQLRPDLEMNTNDLLAAVERIRSRLSELHAQNPNRFAVKQLERALTCDFEIRRFLFQCDCNEQEAIQMLIEKMEYGRSLDYDNANDLRFPREFYQIGGIFDYEKDADGAPLLYFRAKLHKKISALSEPIKKFVLYQMIRLDLQYEDERRWAIVFDMSETGISNVDFDLLLFLVKAVRCYYPWAIRYIAVVDVPWILRGIWKTFEKCLPDNGRRLIFLMNRKEFARVVAKENLPDFMGGTCKRNYCHVPEGALGAEEVGAKELGLTPTQVKDLKKHFQAFLPKDVST